MGESAGVGGRGGGGRGEGEGGGEEVEDVVAKGVKRGRCQFSRTNEKESLERYLVLPSGLATSAL